MTENGFRLDLAKSRYLKINLKKEILKDSADGLIEDTRFNGPVQDGAEYTEEGIYHIDIGQVFDMPAEDIAFDLSEPVDIPDTGIPLPADITLGGEDSPITPVVTEIQNIPSECVLKKLVASADFIFPQPEFSYTLEAGFPNIKT